VQVATMDGTLLQRQQRLGSDTLLVVSRWFFMVQDGRNVTTSPTSMPALCVHSFPTTTSRAVDDHGRLELAYHSCFQRHAPAAASGGVSRGYMCMQCAMCGSAVHARACAHVRGHPDGWPELPHLTGLTGA
jgi:hypothetical protein